MSPPIGAARAGVFASGGAAIPDSAISQYRMSSGSGTTLANEFGSQPDATLSTDTLWSANADLVDGYGLDFTGSETVDIASNFGFIGSSAQFSFCVTLNMDALTAAQTVWSQSDGTNIWNVGVDTDTDGELGVGYYNGSSWTGLMESSLANTSRLRLGVSFDLSGTPAFEVAINGSIGSDNLSGHPDGAVSSGNILGARNGGGTKMSGVMDNPIWYDSVLSASGFDADYNAQPWS